MKPCPSCKGTDVYVDENLDGGSFVSCRNPDCFVMGPNGANPKEAVEKWDALSRDPEPNQITVVVGYARTITFFHVGPLTLAMVSWKEDHQKRVVVFGHSHCNPLDVYNQEIGERLALRRACGVGIPARYCLARLPEVYSAYRKGLWSLRTMAQSEIEKAKSAEVADQERDFSVFKVVISPDKGEGHVA